MSSDAAELSSISTTLDDVAKRVTHIADRRGSDPEDVVAAELFEVERSLRTAQRQLERVRQRV